MLNKKEFARIGDELSRSEKEREALIQKSRDIIGLSKRIIHALHREDSQKAATLVKEIKSRIKKLPSEDYRTGMRNVALQEYTEALALFIFAKEKSIPTRDELGVDTENYLAGLCDMTGELVRMAVNRAIKKRNDEVFEIKDLVDMIYGEFLQLDIRRGELRKKFDQVKWNLQKLEDVAYSISLKKSK